MAVGFEIADVDVQPVVSPHVTCFDDITMSRLDSGYSSKKYTQIFSSTEKGKYLSGDGLVRALTTAYNEHHYLFIRPDDLWMAIMVQFNLYCTKRAEAMRKLFVDHEDKEKITVFYWPEEIHRIPIQFTELLQERVKDKSFINWVVPKFTTTTFNDTTAFSVVAMSNLKQYFRYEAFPKCGIPGIVLLGEVSDWQDIRARVDKMLKYDVDGILKKWHKQLCIVVDNFVKSAKGAPDIDWWSKMNYTKAYGSGSDCISGWITVLCPFSASGKYREGEIGLSNMTSYTSELHCDMVDLNGLRHDSIFVAGFGRSKEISSSSIGCSIGWNIYLNR